MLTLAALLVAALGAPPPAPTGTAVVFRPEIDLHRGVLEALEAGDRSIIAAPAHESWPRTADPRRVIAIGDRAAAVARARWPDAPRAELLTWAVSNPPPQLRVSVRPAAACTRDELLRRVGAGGWTVLASPDDTTAYHLADGLGATLVTGDLPTLRAAVESAGPGRIWLRAAPRTAVASWARYLGQLSSDRVWIGTDAPGLARFGIATPVEIDIVATADVALKWAHRKRRRRPPPSRDEEAPCRAR